ncbi:hypothetical protein CYLTODRAFT_229632 [Cylindrobasidium torrendii FP15055 ss-10]|uniref:Uncharacterized protein n=1 Tax=Cylindrobasidium torrendii FP15055 ss-10 TaxID=1314674 RepID=A0A0D7ASI4_9AGAR|nr:hypothetical protein CYLTODRAFT_229632 [Cylindrobasidium torrendii FP15055 ss-10]
MVVRTDEPTSIILVKTRDDRFIAKEMLRSELQTIVPSPQRTSATCPLRSQQMYDLIYTIDHTYKTSWSHQVKAVWALVQGIKTFSPEAYGEQEQLLANRCRLLALVLRDPVAIHSLHASEVDGQASGVVTFHATQCPVSLDTSVSSKRVSLDLSQTHWRKSTSNVRQLVNSIMRPMELLTKIAIKMSRATGKAPDAAFQSTWCLQDHGSKDDARGQTQG